MRKAVVVFIVFTAAASAAGVDAKTEQALAQSEHSWFEALVHNDATTLDHLMNDDYVSVNADGIVFTKAQTLARVRESNLPIHSYSLADRLIRVYGKTAVITGESTYNGKTRFRHTEVWIKQHHDWRIISWQGTPIPTRTHAEN